jgi:hypothetical protein
MFYLHLIWTMEAAGQGWQCGFYGDDEGATCPVDRALHHCVAACMACEQAYWAAA